MHPVQKSDFSFYYSLKQCPQFYETEAMQQMLEEAGYQIVPFQERADVYVINTCSVTNIVDAKSIMGIFSLDLSRSIDLAIHAEEELDKILEVIHPYLVES